MAGTTLTLDPTAPPKNVTALRTLLLSREQDHVAELEAAREGLKEQVLQNEQLKGKRCGRHTLPVTAGV